GRAADPFNDVEPVDSSAAAIAAQGLLRLGRYLSQQGADGTRYTQAGLLVLDTLFDPAGPYLSTAPQHQGLLLHSIYHRPNGWDLALCGRRADDAVRQPIDDLQSAGAAVLYRPFDVSHTVDHAPFVAAVRERWGRIDALVNNAGRAPRVRADLLDATVESFDEVLRANLYGAYFLTQQVARAMVDQRSGDRDAALSIVFVTSVSAAMASVNRGE